jgi:hypothetical protein
MRRRSLLGSGVVCVTFAFVGVGVAGAGAHTPATDAASGSASPLPDVTALIGPATKRGRATAKPQFERDVLYEADGATRGGKPVSSVAGIVSRRFVFDGTPGSKYASATLTYGPEPKRFGRVVGVKQPFLEDVPIPRAPTMTLAQALARVRKAGYRRGFSAVTLRNPLGPTKSNPLYIFTVGSKYVAVNTVTRKVSVLR